MIMVVILIALVGYFIASKLGVTVTIDFDNKEHTPIDKIKPF